MESFIARLTLLSAGTARSAVPAVVGCIVLAHLALTSSLRAGEPASPAQEEAKSLSFPFSYTGEGLANLSGGTRRGAIYDAVASLGIKGDLDKLTGWRGGSFLVSGLYPHGASLTGKYVHDFNDVSNIDAYDSLRLYEAWLEQEFADGKGSIRLGQILADTEFFVSSNAALFVNSAFGAIPLVSQNFDAPVYPVAAPGARVRWTFSDSLSLQAGLFDGDVGDPAVDNKHGVDWHLNPDDGVLALSEIAYTKQGGKEGLAGVYKLGGFYHHSESSDSGSHTVAGAYIIADQQLWRKPGTEDQGLCGFVRIGGAPGELNTVPFYLDAGFNIKGLLPGRDEDIAGIGFSYTKLGTSLRDGDDSAVASRHEAILEATYKFQTTKWSSVQPDIQYVFNPGESEKKDNAFVAGIRLAVTF